MSHALSDDADDTFREQLLLSFRAFPRAKKEAAPAASSSFDQVDATVLTDDQKLRRVTSSSSDAQDPLVQLLTFLVEHGLPHRAHLVLRTVLLWIHAHYLDWTQRAPLALLLKTRVEPALDSSSLDLLHLALSAKSKPRDVQITRSTRADPLPFTLIGGYERGGAIFVHQVACASQPQPSSSSAKGALEVGDELLSVNGQSFASMPLDKAYAACHASTHLALVVRANPYAYRQMAAVPVGQRVAPPSATVSLSSLPSSLATASSASPQTHASSSAAARSTSASSSLSSLREKMKRTVHKMTMNVLSSLSPLREKMKRTVHKMTMNVLSSALHSVVCVVVSVCSSHRCARHDVGRQQRAGAESVHVVGRVAPRLARRTVDGARVRHGRVARVQPAHVQVFAAFRALPSVVVAGDERHVGHGVRRQVSSVGFGAAALQVCVEGHDGRRWWR